MKAVRNSLGPLHGNVVRQQGVGATYPGRHVALQGRVKVHDLHQPVNACIGPAGAHHAQGRGREAAQRAFKLVLNGEPRKLALPALVSTSVVADAKGDSGQAQSLIRTLAVRKVIGSWLP